MRNILFTFPLQLMIIFLVALGNMATSILTPRDLSMGEGPVSVVVNAGLPAFNISRSVTAVILACCIFTIIRTLLRGGLPKTGFYIWASYVVYFALNYILPMFAGEVPKFELRYLYPALLFTAIYLSPPVPMKQLISLLKFVLCIFIYGSVLAMLIVPNQVIAANYNALIPDINFRLYGLGGGATSLGPLAAMYLLIELESASQSKARYLHIIVATVVLLLAQSKTAWIIMIFYILYFVYKSISRYLFDANMYHAKMFKNVFMIIGFAGFFLIVFSWLDRVDFSALNQGDSIQTMTGRSYIWESTLRVWLNNPVFGYGLGLWENEGFRSQYGEFAHAHNQYLQSLGSAGLFGLAGLLIYLQAACTTVYRTTSFSTVPLIILLVMIVLTFTEVPFRSLFILESFTLMHLLLFAFLVNISQRNTYTGTTEFLLNKQIYR